MADRRQSTLAFKFAAADVPPGYGADEYVADGDEFDMPPNWRRTLSNFSPCSFTLDGVVWPSVEHYFQATKFRYSHPDYYAQFHSGDGTTPGSMVGRIGADVKRAGRRYNMTARERASWDSGRSRVVLMDAQRAKFEQDETARAVLLATKRAILVHRPTTRSALVIERDLMAIRDDLTDANTVPAQLNRTVEYA